MNGIDLNMGCLLLGVTESLLLGLINNRPLAKEIIDATKEGAAGIIPVSIKIFFVFGFDFEPILLVLEQKPAGATVHAAYRLRNVQGSGTLGQTKNCRCYGSRNSMQTLSIGNGDISSLSDAKQKVADAGTDGAMIGRGIFRKPLPLFGTGYFCQENARSKKMHLLPGRFAALANSPGAMQ